MQNADVETTDHVATNGVVHILDLVITPPTKTLAQVIGLTKRFRLFGNSARAEGLLSILNDADQHFTLFIPSNRAIKKCYNKMVKALALHYSVQLMHQVVYLKYIQRITEHFL